VMAEQKKGNLITGKSIKPFVQRAGKMKEAGLGEKAKKVARTVPTGPMKGIR
jgi:hypothetical protein